MLPDPDEFDASRFVRNSNELRNDSLHSSAASILGRLVVRDRKPVPHRSVHDIIAVGDACQAADALKTRTVECAMAVAQLRHRCAC